MILLIPLAFIMAVPIYFLKEDWAGWLTLYATFAVVPLFLSFKRRPRVVLAIWGTLVLHHSIAIANAYATTLFGAEADAADFHASAAAIATIGGLKFGLGSTFYTMALAAIYNICGASHLLGEETSVLAYALSCIVLVKMLDLLNVKRHQVACVLIFGLHPAIAIFTSVTLRESWQIFLFMQSVYCLLRFRLHAKPLMLVAGVAAAALLGCLHNGLIVYSILMIPYALFFNMGVRSTFSFQRLLGVGLTGTVLAGLGAALMTKSLPYTPTLEHFTEGSAMSYAAKYREKGEKGARAEYGVKLDASSPASFAAGLPLVYVYYMLSPFPWQIRAAVDVFGACEAWLRVLLLVFALKAWKSRPAGAPQRTYMFLILLYFSMSLLWSMGTINYGTAIRHHVVPFWILIILGAPTLLERTTGLFQRFTTKPLN